jgi:penicillin amidase
LPGLRRPVTVLRDRWGIPHVYAENAADLFRAQGFLHAQERMWQMELNRRTARGALAAVFGDLALDTDRLTRTLGFWRLAQADHTLADGADQEMLDAYAGGVNAYLERGRLPVEFRLLGLKPDPWTPLDTLGIGRLLIFNLSAGWAAELVRAQLIEKLGAGRAAELDLHWPERDVPTLPEGIVFNRLQADGMVLAERGPFLGRSLDGGGQGSNAWALAGSRTTTGRPILCNDMHLKVTTPGIWYLMHLDGGPYHVTGVSVAGIPAVEVGHNDRIAWGCTLTFTDNQDLFVERLDPGNDRRYEFRGEWLDCEVIPEAIAVKGRTAPHVEDVRLTHHGPIVGGVLAGAQAGLADDRAQPPGRDRADLLVGLRERA